MLHFFSKKRYQLAAENRVAKYLRYAIGEILLVVIGILIALQVNNWNVNRMNRNTELDYLQNIKLDLLKDIEELRTNIKYRNRRYESAKKIVEQINGSPVDDLTELSANIMHTLWEERFVSNNVTYTEMESSGNLKLISSDSIKKVLLELESLYKTNEFYNEHENFDYREYISKPLLQTLDIEQLKPVYLGEKTAEEQNIGIATFSNTFHDLQYKNGCSILYWSSQGFITLFQNIEAKSRKAIELIDIELNIKD